MNMEGMHHEDQDNKKLLDATINRDKLMDEADIVLVGKANNPHQNYEVTKPEGGFNGVELVADPYKFADQNLDKKVLVIHGDGSFDRYNHTSEKPAAETAVTPTTPTTPTTGGSGNSNQDSNQETG